MYRKILVPLDGSTFAETALPYALTVSRKSGADVELVMVEEPNAAFAHHEWTSAVREWSVSYLDDMAARIRSAAGAAVSTTHLEGTVWEALVRRTVESATDLVVLATHGRGALSRAWLGSVADSFVRHTDRPVLLVRPEDSDEAPDPTAEVRMDSVLVPLDGSDLSRAILEPALTLASLFDARLTLLRVLSFPTEIASPYLPDSLQMNVALIDEAREAARASLEELAAELAQRGVSVTSEIVVDAHAAHAILKRAGEIDSAAIALATHGRSGMARFVLGSTTDKVVRGTNRPVLVLRPPEEA